MPLINMHTAKTQLSDLVRRAQAGEEIVIARDGEPAAKLVAVDSEPPGRKFGALAGHIVVPPEFFEPLPATELDAWGE